MSDLASHQSPVLVGRGETEIRQRLTIDVLGSSQHPTTGPILVEDRMAETDRQYGDQEVLGEWPIHCAEHVTDRRGHGAEEEGKICPDSLTGPGTLSFPKRPLS